MNASRRLAVLALAAVCGCAVLTVDVDVYKGPLANHEDVQMEQLAVMAVGARPLLIRLRTDLEDQEAKAQTCADQPPKLCATCASQLCQQCARNFCPDRVSRPDPEAPARLCDQCAAKLCADCKPKPRPVCNSDDEWLEDDCLLSGQAKVVNAILGLYLDAADPQLTALYERGMALFAEAESVRAVLDDFASDVSLKEQIEAARDPNSRDASATAAQAIEEALSKDANNYRQLDRLYHFLRGEAVPATHAPQSSETTDQFALLTDREKVAEAVTQLLPDEDNAALRASVVDRFVAVGKAFLRGREIMEEGVRVSLEYLVLVATESGTRESRDESIANVAQVVVRLVKYETLLKLELETRLVPELRLRDTVENAELKTVSPNEGAPEKAAADSAAAVAALLDKEDIEKLMHELASRLSQSDSAAVAHALLSIHLEQVNQGKSDPKTRDDDYGIARALSHTPEEQVETRLSAREAWVRARPRGQLGLGEGRLDAGLVTLIKRYLEARDVLGAEGQPTKDLILSRRQLTDALTHFAQKILVIVNNETLWTEARETESSRTYVPVLQSIGSSILTLNDELHHRWTYEDEQRLTSAAAREALAMQAAWTMTPAHVLDGVVLAVEQAAAEPKSVELSQRQTWLDAKKKADDSRDVVAAARAEHDKALAGLKPDATAEAKQKAEEEVKRTKGALDTAEGELTDAEGPLKKAKEELDKSLRKLKDEVLAAIAEVRNDVLTGASADPATYNTELTVRNLLIAKLRASSDTTAADFVAGLPGSHFAPPMPGKVTRPADVLDQLVASLRHAQVHAATSHPDTAALLAEALHLSETFRSGLVYIRPPSSYLRNSTPASALIEGNAGWRNELFASFKRTLGVDHPNEDALRAIDSQFWQRINQVRVAGSGDSDYVLVKDPLGNWNVHSYSDNPESVIKGAKSILLAGASGKLGADLFDAVKQVRPPAAGSAGTAVPQSVSVTERSIDRFEARYVEDTRTLAKELRATAAKIAPRVIDQWEASPDWNKPDVLKVDAATLKADVERLKAESLALEAAPSDTADGETWAKDCRTTIARLLDFRDAELALLGDARLVIEGDPEGAETKAKVEKSRKQAATLRAAVVSVVGKPVTDALARRRDAVEDFETALAVLGDSRKEKAP